MLFSKPLLTACSLILLTAMAIADDEERPRNYPQIYPFVPVELSELYADIAKVTENENFIRNVNEIFEQSLTSGSTFRMVDGKKVPFQPWMSTYWPLNNGLIADPYKKSFMGRPLKELGWKKSHRAFERRDKKLLRRLHKMDQKDLDTAAPSEKYDILIGDTDPDTGFDLTRRLWDYTQKWGSNKEHAFTTKLYMEGGNALEAAAQLESFGIPKDRALQIALKRNAGLIEYYALEKRGEGEVFDLVEAMQSGWAIEMAKQEKSNYVLAELGSGMALWEGICHGWSLAAGIIPRPRQTVEIKLDRGPLVGKTLRFYPDDIKALASLLLGNSMVQDSVSHPKVDPQDPNSAFKVNELGEKAITGGIIMQGIRCNERPPKKDEWGRFYDTEVNPYTLTIEPSCVGVHPAIWHLALVNILGKEGRSFVVERKVKAAVDNHPLTRYSMRFFNPYSGQYAPMDTAIQPRSERDYFKKFRNPNAKSILGVALTMTYLNWNRPKRETYDNAQMDDLKDIEMYYDLELDENMNIVGGQWRTTEDGKGGFLRSDDRTQPDFFWTLTKDWQRAGEVKGESRAYLSEVPGLTDWDGKGNAPYDWLPAARAAHSFIYEKTRAMGFNEVCKVKKVRGDNIGHELTVPCDQKYNRPQPLANLVYKLVEMAQ